MLPLRVTEGVATLLEEAASCSSLPNDVREDAQKLHGAEQIDWSSLKAVADAYRAANPGKPVYLHKICSQRDVILPSPPVKEKSPELVARLAKLQAELDNKRYDAMVADVTSAERKADEMRGVLPNARLQLSFGAHVLVTMFTFWATAFYGTKIWFGWDPLWSGMAGAVGLTCGLLIETVLLIIRTNRFTSLEDRMPELFDKDKVREAYAKLKEIKQREAERKKAQPREQKHAKRQEAAEGEKAASGESKKSK
ncbi:hypothetical protein CHLRE_10g438750v5 [Chlamydomonas reinhardtii]|uniref:Uncharacterized protein n=1 Tax=Chlamydomonas reinhardtii TaxID=3055 RepID=A8IIR9_CHLRE|nr:uncharacterized protein CHLRE_10g438750v5 [Chlamydomonas reinhardtii]PNW77486.1 hypothetical protein CHLRE_10g438750v5 [Chlamydomonas reinhardtii]|eukprot:XP_001690561.1 predicted protein [Chlamydomonas reinhardtii]